MAAASPTATVPVAHRSGPGTYRCRTMVRNRMPRNDSITPEAARSCKNVFAVMGIRPTSDRCTPTDAISMTSTTDERRPRARLSTSRSVRTRRANRVMSKPVTIMVALNV